MANKRLKIEENEDDESGISDAPGSESEEIQDYSSNIEDSGSNASENETDNEDSKANSGWADAISKILRTKPKTNQPIVLSKAKKLTEVKAKPKPAGFEVAQADGKVKKEVIEEKPSEIAGEKPLKRRRKKDLVDLRVKPNVLQKDRERVLSRIATKGVVQLFNAVRAQQKDITEKIQQAGPLDVKKTKVMKSIDKNTFLDVLMGEKSQNVEETLKKSKKIVNNTNDVDTSKTKGKVWDVLRDNFMMDAKMKDWDKEMEIEDENEVEME